MDIITEIDAHAPLVYLAAKYNIPVICQKPMAPDLESAEKMVAVCEEARTPLYIHENFRWQTPVRAVKQALDTGEIGAPFRAQIQLISGFPTFVNQPLLKTLKHFIITDLGSHLLDLGRFLFGEANNLYCQVKRVHTDIAGEDVATIMLNMGDDVVVLVKMAYAENYLEIDPFPQPLIFIEGNKGSVELSHNYWLRVTTRNGTFSRRVPPPRYPWADPNYEVVHASIVPCNGDLLRALQGKGQAETTGEDNLKTVRLVWASYDLAYEKKTVLF